MVGWFTWRELLSREGVDIKDFATEDEAREAITAGKPERPHESQALASKGIMQYYLNQVQATVVTTFGVTNTTVETTARVTNNVDLKGVLDLVAAGDPSSSTAAGVEIAVTITPEQQRRSDLVKTLASAQKLANKMHLDGQQILTSLRVKMPAEPSLKGSVDSVTAKVQDIQKIQDQIVQTMVSLELADKSDEANLKAANDAAKAYVTTADQTFDDVKTALGRAKRQDIFDK